MTATRRITDTLIIFALVLLVWQILHQIAGATALPAPLPTMTYLMHMVPTARFAENAAATLKAFALALAAAYAIGLAMGVWLGAHRLSGAVGEPILVVIYSLPKITLYPVVLLIFGLGISGKVVFGAMHGILPVALLTMGAIRAIPPVYLRSAQTLQPVAMADHHHRAAAGRIAGSVHRVAYRLLRHAARRASRRDVRLQARPRLHDHGRHVARAERGHGDGRDHLVRLRGDRQCGC